MKNETGQVLILENKANLVGINFGGSKMILHWRESILVVHKRRYFWQKLILADLADFSQICQIRQNLLPPKLVPLTYGIPTALFCSFDVLQRSLTEGIAKVRIVKVRIMKVRIMKVRTVHRNFQTSTGNTVRFWGNQPPSPR